MSNLINDLVELVADLEKFAAENSDLADGMPPRVAALYQGKATAYELGARWLREILKRYTVEV